MGVENPLGLEHAEGYWFGIGKQGPFRTNGYEVDPLVGSRQRTWAGINQLGQSWVRYHPERRLVLFGVHPQAGAPDGTYPWVLLTWDCDRDVWQPNWKFAGTPRLFMAQAIASTTAIGPVAPPSAPNTTGITSAGWTANWTAGDATAETEYWEQTGAGPWTLTQVLAPAVVFRVSVGLSHTQYKWRVRHRKNGLYSPYASDVTVQTLIAQPSISFLACLGGHVVKVRVSQNSTGTSCPVEVSAHGANTWVGIDSFSGASKDIQTSTNYPGGVDIRAHSHDAAWSVPDSAYDQVNGLVCP